MQLNVLIYFGSTKGDWQASEMNPQASYQGCPTQHLSLSLWVARPWPSNFFKRMATSDVPQEPIACALPDEWLQQLFVMHVELWSDLAAAITPCFRDVCGYCCKDVKTARPKVQHSCTPRMGLTDRHAHPPTHTHTHTYTGTKRTWLLDQESGDPCPKHSPLYSSMCIWRRGSVGWRIEWIDAECNWMSKIQASLLPFN